MIFSIICLFSDLFAETIVLVLKQVNYL